MLWKGLRRSTNVQDNRKLKVTKLSLGAAVIGTIIGSFVAYGPSLPTSVTEQVVDTNKMSPARFSYVDHADFIKAILGSTEDVWRKIFIENKKFYSDAKLILFTGTTSSACGAANSDIGPFYCSGDNTVYIDLNFFAILDRNLGAPGDAPQGLVVAHEVGHHVQNLLGTLPNTYAKMQRMRNNQKASNQLLVKLELQADCYAGIWMHHVKYALEPGDLAEAANAASRIGDDWLQTRGGGVSMPDSFTHGTATQRASWLLRGYQSGKMKDCDTFATSSIDIVK